MAFEVDETGLTTPTASEVRELIVALWREKFGADAQVDGGSPDGLEIDIDAIVSLMLWQGLQKAWNDGFFRTADGVALDLILDPFGKQRLAASNSTALAVAYGTNGTNVPAGTVATVQSTGDAFETDEAATIATAELFDVVLVFGAEDEGSHIVNVDFGGPVGAASYIASAPDTNLDVAQELANDLNVNATFAARAVAIVAGTDEAGRARIVIDSRLGGVAPTYPSPTRTQAEEAVAVTMTAQETGVRNASIGELDVVTTPVVGMLGIVNYETAVPGRDVETDPEFRDRHLDTLSAQGCGTPEAIRDRLLVDVETVISVAVYENEGSTPDAEGRPPHSFEAVVLSEPSGGPYTDDQAVAESIFGCKPAGIQAYGSTVVVVTDSNDQPRNVGFSRPAAFDLYIEIDVTQGEGFPTTGDPATAITESVAAFLLPGGDGALGMGSDLERFRLHAPILDAVPQVAGAAIRVARVPTGDPAPSQPYPAADLVTAADEILLADASRIDTVIL